MGNKYRNASTQTCQYAQDILNRPTIQPVFVNHGTTTPNKRKSDARQHTATLRVSASNRGYREADAQLNVIAHEALYTNSAMYARYNTVVVNCMLRLAGSLDIEMCPSVSGCAAVGIAQQCTHAAHSDVQSINYIEGYLPFVSLGHSP